ncbi:MAG: biotin--[acetyl-CoA-carboxylase] ligase [Bacteroidetes bacterium]|nr:biotin--[acetyl-CoA-carboxylase] ligase [Bacteroidota bacterium]
MRPPIHTLFIGKTHHHLGRVGSTNAWLKQWLESAETPVPEGLVVTADEQFAGKGQGDKSWQTTPGLNLTASILLRPVFLEPRQVFYLNKAIALAVHDTLATEVYGIQIKWPNDMYYAKSKLAGILIENILGSYRIQQSIVGIGINVNQDEFDAALPNPISIKSITGRQTDLSDLLEKLCSQLEKYYLQLRASQFTTIDALYHHHLYGHQQEQEFILDGNVIKATLNGVSASGKLILSTSEKKYELSVGEVQWVI